MANAQHVDEREYVIARILKRVEAELHGKIMNGLPFVGSVIFDKGSSVGFPFSVIIQMSFEPLKKKAGTSKKSSASKS